jgi:hypothetical protein
MGMPRQSQDHPLEPRDQTTVGGVQGESEDRSDVAQYEAEETQRKDRTGERCGYQVGQRLDHRDCSKLAAAMDAVAIRAASETESRSETTAVPLKGLRRVPSKSVF